MITKDKFDALRRELGGISEKALRTAVKRAGIVVLPKGKKTIRVEVAIEGATCNEVRPMGPGRVAIECHLEIDEKTQVEGE